MEEVIVFNLQHQISEWVNRLKSQPALTTADAEELKTHLLDMIDELQALGLDEEEAFWVASKRMGTISAWEADYSKVNKPVIQLRRSLIILAGVLAYFLLYNLINCSSKFIYIILLWNNVNGYLAIDWVSKYLIALHFMFIVFAGSIYFSEQKTIAFIENIKLTPKHTVYLLLIAILLSIIDTCLNPIVKSLIRHDRPLISHFYAVYLYFNYSFPFIICASFTILYARYYRKANF